MLVVISTSSALFTALSTQLQYTVYREQDYELLQHIALATPLPYIVSLHTQHSSSYDFHHNSILIQIPNSSSVSSSHMTQELAMLCGILYAFPVQIQCILYLDIMPTHIFHKQRNLFKENIPAQYRTIDYFFAHSIYADTYSSCLYTDILLPTLPHFAVAHAPLHFFSTLVQKYWSSHCIQSLHIIDKNSTELSPVQLKKNIPAILECIQSLQSLNTEVRFTNTIQRQLQDIKLHFGFSKTQMAKLYTLIRGQLQINTDIPDIFSLAQTIASNMSSKKSATQHTFSVLNRNTLFVQLCEQLLEM